jgi:lysophospholipid acyltransferase (LPLAT)-like uncharacterized protein
MGAAFDAGLVLRKTWDRYRIAWPFSRVVVRLGPPLEPEGSLEDVAHALGVAIEGANAAAAEALG